MNEADDLRQHSDQNPEEKPEMQLLGALKLQDEINRSAGERNHGCLILWSKLLA